MPAGATPKPPRDTHYPARYWRPNDHWRTPLVIALCEKPPVGWVFDRSTTWRLSEKPKQVTCQKCRAIREGRRWNLKHIP